MHFDSQMMVSLNKYHKFIVTTIYRSYESRIIGAQWRHMDWLFTKLLFPSIHLILLVPYICFLCRKCCLPVCAVYAVCPTQVNTAWIHFLFTFFYMKTKFFWSFALKQFLSSNENFLLISNFFPFYTQFSSQKLFIVFFNFQFS